MKAMIFAAGIGSRLKPWSLYHPKALVEVGGEAMLGRVINKLKDAGVCSIVINIHHFGQQIKDYLVHHNNFGIDMHISDETDLLLDTGGGLRKAAPILLKDNEPVILHNADILTDFSLSEMTTLHLSGGQDATLLADRRNTSRYLLFDDTRLMKGWTNMKTSEIRPEGMDASKYLPLAFGGVHIISTEMIKLLTEQYAADKPFSIIDFYISNCRKREIRGFTPSLPYRWHDVGKPESLAAARADMIG